jgi:DNA-binding NarL/FixJ family response regulator
VAQGKSNQEIAQALVISESTVKNHLRNILGKLHLRNRIEAAVYAVRQGLVEDPPQE